MLHSSAVRSVRALLALAVASAVFGSTAPSPLYSVYQERLQFSAVVLTALFSVYAIGVLASLLLLGRLSDRLADRRQILVPALALVSLGSLTFAGGDSLAGLFAGRILSGIGTGALTGSCGAALADIDQLTGSRRAALLSSVAFTLGAALGPTISSAALHFDLWPTVTPFVVNALLATAVAIGLTGVSWPRRPCQAAGVSARVGEPFARAIRPVLPEFLLACAILLVAWGVGSVFMALGPSMVMQIMKTESRAGAGLIVTVFQLCAGVSQLVSQRLVRRMAVRLACVLLAAAWIGCTWATWAVSPLPFTIAAIAAGLGYGAAFVGCAGKVNEIAPPAHRAKMVSLFLIAGYVGSAFAVLGLGALVDGVGMLDAMLIAGICLTFAVGVIVMKLRPRLPPV